MTIESLFIQEETTVMRTAAGERALLGAAIQAEVAEIRRNLDGVSSLIGGLTAAERLDGGTTDRIASHAARRIPRWHFPMLNDVERNDAFAAGIDKAIRPGDTVLDIGTGTGLLAMLSVQAGARHVYSCEADPLMAEIARNVIHANGMADSITVLTGLSSDLVVGRDLPAPVDVIVTEIVDCGLIGEGLLPTIRHARTELLRPGGTLVPGHAQVHGALVSSTAARRLNTVTQACGFDIRTLNRVSTAGHFPIRLGTWPHEWLSPSHGLLDFDLLHDPLVAGSALHMFTVQSSGLADGIAAWFSMDLGHGVVLRNTPDNPLSHWMQAFVPFTEPVAVEAGEALEVCLNWSDFRLHATPTRASDRPRAIPAATAHQGERP